MFLITFGQTAEAPIGETTHAGRHPAAVTAAVIAATSELGTHLVTPRLILSTTSSFVEAVIEAEEAKVAMKEEALAKAKEDRRKELQHPRPQPEECKLGH